MTAVGASEAAAVTESEESWTEAEVPVLFGDYEITTDVYGVVGDVGDITTLWIGIKDNVILTDVKAATAYMYTRGTCSTTAGRASIST